MCAMEDTGRISSQDLYKLRIMNIHIFCEITDFFAIFATVFGLI